MRSILIVILSGVLLFAGVIHVDLTLEDQKRSSSVFLSYEEMVLRLNEGYTFDSYESIENYPYTLLAKQGNRDYCLKDIEYHLMDEVQIPGMPGTKDADLGERKIFSTAQCPQGICMSEEYLFLSSYSSEADCMGAIMVFDRAQGDYLFTIGMNKKSHLGGIAFDGENLWACSSQQKQVERLSYDLIRLMARENVGEYVNASGMTDIYEVSNSPSCITCHDGRLWIASHAVDRNASVVAYYYDKKQDQLQRLTAYQIPTKVQGIAFSEDGKVYLSRSWGRNASSYLTIYDSIAKLSAFPEEAAKNIEMPPCSEELILMDGQLYILFESAGEKYFLGTDGNGVSISPIDKILSIPLDDSGYIISR